MTQIVRFELHTHTLYSDGKSTVAENAQAALDQNINLGISDHGSAHMFFGINQKNIPLLTAEIHDWNVKHPRNPTVLQGIEANLLKKGRSDLSIMPQCFDFVLLGYHRGVFPRSLLCASFFASSIIKKDRCAELMTDALIETFMNDSRIQVITHPGEYIPVCIEPLAIAAKEYGVLLEINEHHPLSLKNLELAAKHDVSFLLSTDAHEAELIGKFPKSSALIAESKMDTSYIVNHVDYVRNDTLRLDTLYKWSRHKNHPIG